MAFGVEPEIIAVMLAVVLAFTLAPVSQQGLPPVAKPVARLAEWRRDIDFATTELAKRHKNLFANLSKAAWAQSAEAAKQALGKTAAPARFAVAMLRHVARIGDAHTNFLWGQLRFPRCPLRLDTFAEGLFVVANGSPDVRLTGARVAAVEGVPVARLWARLRPLIAHENAVLLRRKSLQLAIVPAILHAAGIAERPDRLRLRCTGPNGKAFDAVVAALPETKWRGAKYRSAFRKTPLCLTTPRVKHWYRYLPAQKVMYLKYNSCTEGADFERVCKAMWKALGDRELARFVLDVRHNGGGSEFVILPLLRGLNRHKQLRNGGLYVIIGRGTFSSGMNNAITLKQRYRATLVGEATGGKPNHFGEIRHFTLPATKVRIYYSTNYFRKVKGDPPSLLPDIAIELRAADYFAGRDPFLEAVLAAK